MPQTDQKVPTFFLGVTSKVANINTNINIVNKNKSCEISEKLYK